ncbi:hypothetical protein C2G38_613333 [Gigaspora rosea]|uniref:Uncharacterized protein n=1 Tax=Gigaspora rosea TaxID=44941 RepID=A0A397U6D5_9GLOM|nr:hypothetical protein C2G38_613333 [Gigaspora rosea]
MILNNIEVSIILFFLILNFTYCFHALQMIKPKSEQKYLIEFIKQIKQILQDPEQFEIYDNKLDSINVNIS